MDQVNRLKQEEGIGGGGGGPEGGEGNLHRRPPASPTSTTTTFTLTPGSLAIPGPTGNLPIVPPHPHATIEPFIQDSLKQSIDLPAYISWQTLSTEVTHRLRQGSLRINRSNQLEFTSLEDGGKNEKTPLIDQITSRQRKSPDSPAVPVRYPDINSNESGKGTASSWKVGVFLLVNTALGAGILNYPAAYDRLGGIWISTVLQAIVLLMMASTMLALVFCADLHRDTTYHDVLRSMCGNRAQQLAAASIMCTCFGINVTFLIIIGDQFDRLLSTFIGPDFCTTFVYSRNFIIPVVAVCLIWPICYFKRLDFLRYVSTVGIFAMIYVVFLNVYEYFALEVTPGVIKTEPSSVLEVATSLPVIFFAYQSHEIVLPIYSSMAKPRSKNFIKSTAASLTLLFFIYTMGGTYGYLTFGSKVIADIIMMYDARDPVVTSGIIALIIKMITTYPPLMFCGRGAFDGLYAEWRQLSAEAFIRGERWRRLVITTFWNAAALMLAIVTPNITVAIEMLGSLAACNVFVFPGMCMVSLARRHLNGYYGKLKNERRMLRRLEGSGHWTLVWSALLVYGAFIILFGVAMFAMVFVQVYYNMSETAGKTSEMIVAGGGNSTTAVTISTSALCGIHHI